MNGAPFEKQYGVRFNAEKHQQEYVMAAETVLESPYLDDTRDSTETEDNAIYLYEELKKLCKFCGMKPHKWLSNSRKVLDQITIDETAKKIDIKDNILPSTKDIWNSLDDRGG